MGAFFSCPLAKYIDVENGMESITVKSISFGDDVVKTPVRSVSFNSRDLEPMIMKSIGSGRMKLETSVSFKGRELEKMVSMEAAAVPLEEKLHVVADSAKSKEMENQSPRSESHDHDEIKMTMDLNPTNPKHMAAMKLQKVYKSFRTRRKLADCAVLVEQSWWKLLDFAELKRSSISFFDIEKHETAISRWARARTRAAKVGKGLSKNDKGQKLALQHWLEAIDPRHRYGHNLQFYYAKWLHCQSGQPFFYWLDIGEGKEVNLVEQCPRSKLQQQCIKYLGPLERVAYEVVVEDGKFMYKLSRELLHTTGVDKHVKWIFVLSTSKALYVGKKQKGTFQHSSFLAGGATSAAGRLVVENGILKAVWPHSGHYRPTEENFQEFISFLTENNVNLTDVKMSPDDDEENGLQIQKSSLHVRFGSTEEDWAQKFSGDPDDGIPEIIAEEMTGKTSDLPDQETSSTAKLFEPKRSINLSRKLTILHIPDRGNLIEKLEMENQEMRSEMFVLELDTEGPKKNYLEEETGSCEVEIIPDESILKRINSHKETKSYQLGRQLSCKWTTGAGPRIGCVRDYPVELQLRALEQVSLSPRKVKVTAQSEFQCSPRIASMLSPRVSRPIDLIHQSNTQTSSPLFKGTSAVDIGNDS
ncbi:IQ domain-containing protein IQM2-like [Benincasa hispida]|uniref:IQ domain-containing protein IQM2-like n=1 Tax=Benincasa hispida TaxID=102211 RepID=UPI001901D187|nr:IQ domain-containing protein IQM2-like [Benincasa hispida]